MKSLVMSAFLLTSAGGSALGILVSPLAREGWLVGMYGGLGVVAAGAGCVFWWVFRDDDREEGKGGYELVGREREM
jgi:dipeptide/tripeptide permease